MNENVKAYLDNIRHLVGLESAYNDQLLTIRLIGYTAPISNYDNTGGKSGTRGDSTQERYIIALENLQEKIKDKAIAYADTMSKFYEELDKMPSALNRLVLLMYYGNRKSIKDICKELDKCESSVKKTLFAARQQFATIMQM